MNDGLQGNEVARLELRMVSEFVPAKGLGLRQMGSLPFHSSQSPRSER